MAAGKTAAQSAYARASFLCVWRRPSYLKRAPLGTRLARLPGRTLACGRRRSPVEGVSAPERTPEKPVMNEESKSLPRSMGGIRRAPIDTHVAFVRSFVGQAVAVVARAHAALLPLFVAGVLSALQFALAAVAMCGGGIAVLVYRLADGLADLHAALMRFGSEATQKSARSDGWGRSLKRLTRDLKHVHRQVADERLRLKSEREDAQRESSANRSIAQQLMRAQRIARVGSWEWERATSRVVCSDQFYHILGVAPAAFRPTPASIQTLIHMDDRKAFRRWLIKLASGVKQQGLDVRVLAHDGELRHVHVLGEALLGASGRTVGVAGTLQDATERTRAIQQIHRLAYFDVLTELPNRSRFHEKLAETLETARRNGKAFAIMFLDLDQFKRINDTLGHAVGDDLLRIIAQRLTRGLRLDDIAGLPQGRTQRAPPIACSKPSRNRSFSASRKFSSRHRSGSSSTRATAKISTRCSRTPTWRCTTPNQRVAIDSFSITTRCARQPRSAFRSSTTCARRSKASSSSCTISRRSMSPPARSSASKH